MGIATNLISLIMRFFMEVEHNLHWAMEVFYTIFNAFMYGFKLTVFVLYPHVRIQ